ncbi:alpha/beta hydrolase [Alcaligenaceae bacterium CGII-47]|nr:alpha/beta hydrolase [Alcaligenaceae bacterium CGII-47]
MAYWEWGDPTNDHVILCVHGLTRTGRDFDLLAQALATNARVVCPDVVGRGRSDWLIDPMSYAIPQYAADMIVLIARLRPARLDWVGTSMGGLIGLGVAGMLAASPALRPNREPWGLGAAADIPLDKMVLNDIGPVLQMDGLGRIGEYVGAPVQFDSFAQAVDYVRETSASFGVHDQAGWEALTQHVFNEQDSHWIKHYDLRMSQAFAAQTPELMRAAEHILWQAYEHLPGEVLIVRGEQSDLLSVADTQSMLERNHRSKLHEIKGVGHAPTLRSAEQIQPIQQFLHA